MVLSGLPNGGSSNPYAFIKVNSDSAEYAQAKKGSKVAGKCIIGTSGFGIMPVGSKGTYTVTFYFGKLESQEATVEVTTKGETVEVNANFDEYGDFSFGNTTDAQLVDIVKALDDGKITPNNLTWAVGDTRTVNLSAMSATGVGESHSAETVTFVIQNIGGVTLSNGKECHYVVGLLNSLANGGYMNSSNTNSGSWKSSARRTWCNSVFRNAIPPIIRGCFKQFKCVTATEYSANTTTTTDDYFALPAEKEIFDARTNSNQTEFNALKQFDWYKTSANRIKKLGNSGSANWWWERSPYYGDSSDFCVVYSDGSAGNYDASLAGGLAPFGCI